MCRHSNDFRFALRAAMVALVGLGAARGAEAAGRLGYRNDTAQPVVVQCEVTVNGMIRRGKPQTLYPGEVALDSLTHAGPRRVVVLDAKNSAIVLYRGEVNSAEDVFYSIRPKTVTLPVRDRPPPPPQVEFVRTTPPAMRR